MKCSNVCGGLPVNIAFMLFDKMVKPVALYGAEIWGTKRYKSLEDVQIKFCKQVLGLPNHAANLASLGECGRYPLFIVYMFLCKMHQILAKTSSDA